MSNITPLDPPDPEAWQHPNQTILTTAATKYVNEYAWTIIGVGDNKKPLGSWAPGAANRYDYHNVERVYDLANAPGIAIITGPSGVVIIDLDNETAIRAWARAYGTPTTRIARTPRGRHLYYKAPTGLHIPPATNILEGVDVRGAESYAVLPPSRLAGGTYTWDNENPIQELPAGVIELIQKAKPERRERIRNGEPFPTGSRNEDLFRMASSQRRTGFDYTAILAALIETNKTRCIPPLSLNELEAITDSVMRYDPEPASSIATIETLRVRAATQDADDKPLLLDRTSLLNTKTLVDTDPEPINWIWENYLAPGTLNMLHGEGGLGKSFLSLKIAEQVLQENGGTLFDKPVRSGGVVILDGENAETQIHSRIHYTTITSNANLSAYTISEPILGYEEHTNQLFDYLATQHDPTLIIVDSQRALWAGDEREQSEAGIMLRRLAKHAEAYKFAILLLHHDNRGGDFSGSSDINAALSGSRFHLRRHKDADKPHHRTLTQPKNRIGPEMPREDFTLDITLQPRTHRQRLSGINLETTSSGEDADHATRMSQARTLACNTGGVSYRDLWAALGWELAADGNLSGARSSDWRRIRDDLAAEGYNVQRTGNLGGQITAE